MSNNDQQSLAAAYNLAKTKISRSCTYSMHFKMRFLPCDAIIARYMPWSCVCRSHSGIVSKQLNVGLCK